MPRASPSRPTRDGNPHVLKRNQVCQVALGSCVKKSNIDARERDRLVINAESEKCDAKRPSCSSCVRSHAYATLHAGPGVQRPPNPECTYDEGGEVLLHDSFCLVHITTGAQIPASEETDDLDEGRYIALESRIGDLEARLRSENVSSGSHGPPPQLDSTQDTSAEPFELPSVPVVPFAIEAYASARHEETASIEIVDQTDSSQGVGQGASLDDFSLEGLDHGQDIVPSSWPQGLPSPSVLRHLAEAFFADHFLAHRLLHAPTFLESLTHAPTHSRYPSVALLHAICAIGSQFVSVSLLEAHAPIDIRIHSSPGNLRAEYASYHAKLARRRSTEDHAETGRIIQRLQTYVLLTWFYWWQAKWIEAYTQAALTLRVAVAMGLNKSPPFQSISQGSTRPLSLLQPPSTLLEAEYRRNAFWLAYAIERHYGCGNGWALSLDDQDVSDLLPLPFDDLTAENSVDLELRQWSLCRDLITEHIPDHTDSFILYIKSCIFLSRVKNFNLRYRARFYTLSPGDAAMAGLTGVTADPRKATDFRELEEITDTFRDTFPPHLKHIMVDGSVDPYLYSALLAPHVGRIALHEPYARVGSASCLSAAHVLRASRSIMELMHVLTSSSYDAKRIGLFPVFAWFTSGRVLTRFLKGAQRMQINDQISTLETEIAYIWAVLTKLGKYVPLSLRYACMLRDHITSICDNETKEKVGLLADSVKLPSEVPSLANAPELLESNQAEADLEVRLLQKPNFSSPFGTEGGGMWYQRIDHPLSS